jgi:hypothetical protein
MKNERPEFSSVGEILTKRGFLTFPGIDSFRRVRNLLGGMTNDQLAVIEMPVLKLLNGPGPIHAEGYIRTARRIAYRGLDLAKFSNLVSVTSDMFGPMVNDSFMYSYSDLVKRGLEPDTIFNHLAVACRQGGRRFGSFYVWKLPQIMDLGGDPQGFRSSALYLNRRSGFKIAKSFMSEAGVTLVGDKSMTQITNDISDIVDNYGKEAAFWSMPGIIDLLSFTDYSVSEYLGELNTIEEKLGEKATNWFAYGVSQIGKSIRDREYKDRKDRKFKIGVYKPIDRQDPRAAIQAFKDAYSTLYPVNRQAAIFLARTTSERADETREAQDVLRTAMEKITKKTDLSRGLWLIPIICTSTAGDRKRQLYANHAIRMLKDFATYYPAGRNDAMHALNITNKASRIDVPFNYALIYPKGKNIDEPDPNWELRYEEPSPVVVFEENYSKLLGETQYDSEDPNWEIREEIPEEEEIILPETIKDTYEMSGHEKNVSELEEILDFRRTNFVTSDIEDAERANLITNEGSDDKKLCPETETQFFIKHYPGQTTLFDSNSTAS